MTTAPGLKTTVDISVLYHLQAPLNAIKGSTAIALGGTSTPGPAETRRIFHAIDRQVDLLNHLVDNLINTVKTEADAAALAAEQPEPFVLEELTINYAERRVTVAGCPVRLTATEYRLLQELSNNAGRGYTHAGRSDGLVQQVSQADHPGGPGTQHQARSKSPRGHSRSPRPP